MDKLTQEIYNEYKANLDITGMVHSVQFEMKTALLNKTLEQFRKHIEDGRERGVPPHLIEIQEARAEAMTQIIIDLTITTIEHFLQEPESMSYEPEEWDGIE